MLAHGVSQVCAQRQQEQVRCVYVTFLDLIRFGVFFFALIALSKCVMAVPKTMPGVKPVCDSKKNNYPNSFLALAYSSFRPEISVMFRVQYICDLIHRLCWSPQDADISQ